MEIKIEDYLTEYEMAEIARSAFEETIRRVTNDTRDTLIYMVTKEYVAQLINECLGEDHGTAIANKVASAIDSLSKYDIFHEASQYSKATLGSKLLEEAVTAQKDVLFAKVDSVINGSETKYFQDSIEAAISDYVRENLFTTKEAA